MVRRALIAVAVLLVGALAYAGVQYYRFVRTETVRIDDRLHLILGGGGNTAVLVGDDGVLVVDTKFMRPARYLAEKIRRLTDKPVRAVVNTHYHWDHTRGNPHYPEEAQVIAQRRTREHMIRLDRRFWEVEPNWNHLPGALLDEERVLEFGGETVRILHPGRGHTDGDVVVQFVGRRLVHMGDLFVQALYPFIDRPGGGSAREWVATLDRVLAIPDVDQYVPGHGPVGTRADVERFQRYLRELVSQVESQVAAGRSLAQAQASVRLAGFDDFRGVPFLTSRRQNVRWVYEEVTAGER